VLFSARPTVLKVFYIKMYFNYTKYYIPIVGLLQLQNTNYFAKAIKYKILFSRQQNKKYKIGQGLL